MIYLCRIRRRCNPFNYLVLLPSLNQQRHGSKQKKQLEDVCKKKFINCSLPTF